MPPGKRRVLRGSSIRWPTTGLGTDAASSAAPPAASEPDELAARDGDGLQVKSADRHFRAGKAARKQQAQLAFQQPSLDVPVLVVRQELLDLEKLGIVYRTGQTRGTRWWLG